MKALEKARDRQQKSTGPSRKSAGDGTGRENQRGLSDQGGPWVDNTTDEKRQLTENALWQNDSEAPGKQEKALVLNPTGNGGSKNKRGLQRGREQGWTKQLYARERFMGNSRKMGGPFGNVRGLKVPAGGGRLLKGIPRYLNHIKKVKRRVQRTFS